MSWLRADCNFADIFPAANGFIACTAQEARRRGLASLHVKCVYPSDSWSAAPDRSLWHDINGRRTMTSLCHDCAPAIVTASEWIAAGYDDDANQSAFAVRAGNEGSAEAWRQMLEVRRLLGLRWRNEVVVDSWVGLDDRRMPVEAFFYRPRSEHDGYDPLAAARGDQRDFLRVTGRWVPVIRWNATDSMEGDATFVCVRTDQHVPGPS